MKLEIRISKDELASRVKRNSRGIRIPAQKVIQNKKHKVLNDRKSWRKEV